MVGKANSTNAGVVRRVWRLKVRKPASCGLPRDSHGSRCSLDAATPQPLPSNKASSRSRAIAILEAALQNHKSCTRAPGDGEAPYADTFCTDQWRVLWRFVPACAHHRLHQTATRYPCTRSQLQQNRSSKRIVCHRRRPRRDQIARIPTTSKKKMQSRCARDYAAEAAPRETLSQPHTHHNH